MVGLSLFQDESQAVYSLVEILQVPNGMGVYRILGKKHVVDIRQELGELN